MDIGTLDRIWRYPVKSMAAQPLAETRIEENGLPGDRAHAFFVESGHARTGKTYRGKEHNLLHLQHDIERARALAIAAGVKTELRSDSEERFYDARPVSLIFDTWVNEVAAALGLPMDPLRWRPNLYACASEDFLLLERDLIGASIEIGDASLRVVDSIERCVTTTYDQQTGESNPDVLRYVAQQRDTILGVYCEVERAGTVRLGEPLRLRAR